MHPSLHVPPHPIEHTSQHILLKLLRALLARLSHPLRAAHTPADLPRGLGMYEPTTAITDFVLTIMALYFARRLWQAGRLNANRAQMAWAAGFVGTALAALAGGIFHGFGPDLPKWARTFLWKLTMIGTGLVSLFLLVGTVYASTGRAGHRLWLTLVSLKSLVYGRWVIRENNFRFVVYDYLSAMLIVLGVQLREYKHRPAARRIAQGIGISFLAAAIQQVGINLHTHFNKNDLYHVIQGIGLWLLYDGARQLPQELSRLDGESDEP